MRAITTIGLILLLMIAVAGCRKMPAAEGVSHGDMSAVIQGNTAFAVDLYQQLRSREGNLFFSPYSISAASALVYAGARGNTGKEIAAVFHFSLPPERLHAGFGALRAGLNAIQQARHVKLSVANSLWAPQGGQILGDYLKLTEAYYGASIASVDYRHPQQVADRINGWVQEKTEGRIDGVVSPGMLDGLTRLILVNAIYFKGKWKYEFEPQFTSNGPFHLGSGESIQTPMMGSALNVRYAQTDDLQILELPYVGEDVSMIILLPAAKDGLGRIEDGLSADMLSSLTERLKKKELVYTRIPKFRMSYRLELKSELQALGMVEVFKPSVADLSGMTDDATLYVDAVVHKAFVEVNEEGTEAAATTDMGIRADRDAVRRRPVRFYADHPFLFLIESKQRGILFFGRVTDPRMPER